MQLSGVLNSQLENPALERTWSHNYVLEYRPLGLVQHPERTPTHVPYLDRVHEVWLELTSKLITEK